MESFIDGVLSKLEWGFTQIGSPLNSSHRCDGCGAQAYAIAGRLESKSVLLFCAHHSKKHKKILEESGFTVVDFEVNKND